MAVLAVHRAPTLTRQRYEAVLRRLTDGPPPASPADLPFEGLLVHVAAETEDGFLIVDVFASQEAFDRFAEAIRPFAREAGIEQPPRAYRAHTYIAEGGS